MIQENQTELLKDSIYTMSKIIIEKKYKEALPFFEINWNEYWKSLTNYREKISGDFPFPPKLNKIQSIIVTLFSSLNDLIKLRKEPDINSIENTVDSYVNKYNLPQELVKEFTSLIFSEFRNIRDKLERIENKIDNIDSRIDEVLNQIQSIDVSCFRIIDIIEQSGGQLDKKIKEELNSFGIDLKKSLHNEQKLKELISQLTILISDPKIHRDILKITPKDKKNMVKTGLRKMLKISARIADGLGFAFAAEVLLEYINQIMQQISNIGEVSPLAVASILLTPAIAIKIKTLS